jgi:membrane-bound serine protease (ClpP class)
MITGHATSGPAGRRRRRAPAALVLGLLACAVVATDAASAAVPTPRPATTAASAVAGRRGIAVVQVQGYLDPPVVALARRAVADANHARTTLLLVQLDSGGALSTDLAPLLRDVRQSRVPVAVWVGPSGARAEGGAALLAEAATVVFVSPGSDVGPASPVRLDDPSATSVPSTAAQLAAFAGANGRSSGRAAALARTRLGAGAAAAGHVTNGVRPTIGEVIVTLDGQTVRTAAGPVHLSTARVIGTGRGRRRQPNQDVVFASLTLGARIQHTLIDPRVAYLLLVAGAALIVFEFFAASVGFAAAVGAVAVLGGAYGCSHLPVHIWAAALIGVAGLGLAIDVQAGRLGPWTVIGGAALLGGSLGLFGGSSRLHVPWWELAVVLVATLLFFVGALPAFVRSRYSTPTVGREGLVGELGQAEVAVDPNGVVTIRGSRWRAYTNRATPIEEGATVRVVAVDGLLLEVEPEAGGARDYRDRARRRGPARSEPAG